MQNMRFKKLNKKTIVIAEAGVNHNGDISIAKKLIDAAAIAKADYVKFQTYDVDSLLLKETKTAEYQKKNLGNNISQYKMLKKYQLSESNQINLKRYATKKKIRFLSTAFDLKSLYFLKKLNLDFIKIPSGEITNYPLLKEISQFKKKILLSTGMATLNEIKAALQVLKKRKRELVILHCSSDYPADLKNLNLAFLRKLKMLGYDVGYSDHSESVITPSIAVTLGCKVIEKHFTLSKKLKGPDHKASLEPNELKDMIKFIKQTELMVGSEKKFITPSEKKTKILTRKSIVAYTSIKKGEIFTKKNLTTKRPGNGISPFLIKKILGKKCPTNYVKNQQIKKY